MKCVSALADLHQRGPALRKALDDLAAAFGGAPADLAAAFVSGPDPDALHIVVEQAAQRGLARHVIGCTAEAIVADGREIDDAPAASLWAVRQEGLRVQPLRIEGGDPDELELDAARLLVLLGDPFSFPIDPWLARLQAAAPGMPVVGGMASAGHRPGSNRLALDEAVFEEGAVAIALDGPLSVHTVVSQGCRPIGRPLIVTRADRNVIHELGRRPALEVFREIYNALGPDDRRLVEQGLHLGRVINEYQERFQRGDFLVRNVIGADDAGAIAISDVVRVGQTVQFHVRDAATADEDLEQLLGAVGPGPVAGALLFTCNGRGRRLFSEQDHDAAALARRFGRPPTAGFFAMGEIGPIGGRNFVHGFTASIALFGPPGPGV